MQRLIKNRIVLKEETGYTSNALLNYGDADFYESGDELAPSGNSLDAGFIMYDRWGEDRRKSGLKKEETMTPDIQTAKPTRLGDYGLYYKYLKKVEWEKDRKKYDITEDGYNSLLDFILNIPLEILDDEILDDLDSLLDQFEYIARVSLNEKALFSLPDELLSEGTLYSRKSTASRRQYARAYYLRNKEKIKKRKKTIAHQKLMRMKAIN